MSLRTRLLTAIVLALLISFSLGASVAVWQAGRSVQAEQVAALANAGHGLAAAAADLPPGAEGVADLGRIVGAFDGDLHVRAALLDANGRTVAESTPSQAAVTPAWLLRLIAPALKPVRAPVRGSAGMVLRLESVPQNEAAERWAELRTRVASFGVFFVLAAGLCSLIVARSLRPLTNLGLGLERVGRGEVGMRLPEEGPSETAALARAFNAMAASLRQEQARSARLSDQVATIAEEERADIARDLHDEIGPMLFALTAFAATIGRHVETGDLAAVPGQVSAIQMAVARLQDSVRDMLGRLRDELPAPDDLAGALADLVAFWRPVRPETRFTLEADLPASLSAPVRYCLFRAAQEAVSNAVRHGGPSQVTVSALEAGGAVRLCVADDGQGGPENPGSGLPGMRARANALGGHVRIGKGPAGLGWRVDVTVPVNAAMRVGAGGA